LSKKEEITTYTYTDGKVSTIDISAAKEAGWGSATVHCSGNPPPAVTKIEMEEVDLSTLTLPFCNLCGDRTTLFKPVGFCFDPIQPDKIHYFFTQTSL